MELQNRNALIQSETDYLQQASYKLRSQSLDDNGKHLLEEMTSLNKSSTDPRHLTIVHSNLAGKVSGLILNKIKQNPTVRNNIFVELQPGFGLVTQSLIQSIEKEDNATTNPIKKFILVESFKKFDKYLKNLENSYGRKYNLSNIRRSPFEDNFLYAIKNDDKQSRRLVELIKEEPTDGNLSIFGILPWNSKGYLSKLFSDFASDRSFFSFENVKSTEFFLYVPEIVLAKLKPSIKKEYSRFNSSLNVMATMFSKIKILDEQKCDFFFPYPIVSTPNKYKTAYQKIDFKKMYLVSLKFDKTQIELKNKHLFYLFIAQIFVRPNNFMKDALKSICTNVDRLCKETSVSLYSPVNSIHPYKFLQMYEYLVQNSEISKLTRLQDLKPQDFVKNKRNSILKTLKNNNKDYTGKFIIGSEKMESITNQSVQENFSKSDAVELAEPINNSKTTEIDNIDDFTNLNHDENYDNFDFENNDKEIKHHILIN